MCSHGYLANAAGVVFATYNQSLKATGVPFPSGISYFAGNARLPLCERFGC